MIEAYYYFHMNGDIIYKNPMVVDMVVDMGGVETPAQYFDSDFVQEYWAIDSKADFVNMINILRVYCDGRKYNVNEQKLIALESKIGIKSFTEELEAL